MKDWRNVAKDEPCPSCSKPDWCSLSARGWIFCRRFKTVPAGFEIAREIGTSALLQPTGSRGKLSRVSQASTPAREPAPAIDFEHELAGIRGRGASLEPWAASLGVPVTSLVHLDAVELERADMNRLRIGFKDRQRPDRALGWPERDASGRVTTIGARSMEGTKGAVLRAPRGLVYPQDLDSIPGPVLVPEGFSDTAASLAMGMAAVGRSSNEAGADLLAALLRTREPIVLGENDCKPDGRWPGRDGAIHVAGKLAEARGSEVRWDLPPGGAKDVRAWLAARVSGGLDLRDDIALRNAGAEFLAAFKSPIVGKPKGSTKRLVVDASTLSAKPIEWLWHPVLPLGQIALLAGHPDIGKSVLTLELAARVSNGTSLPFAQHPPVSGTVLVVSAEDDLERTVLPRFKAAGGNDLRLKLASDESLELGNVANILDALDPELPDDLRLVVVDTLTSLADGIDLNSNAEVRSLYRRLRAFASRRRCVVLVIAHFSKAEGRGPLARISGSTAIGSTPRSAWVALKDPQDESRVLLLKAKMNLAPVEGGFSYRLTDAAVEGSGRHPRIEWGATLDRRTAVEVLRQSERPPEDGETARAALEWLDGLIAPGASLESAKVHRSRKAAGVGERAALDAARRLRIDTRHRPGGMRGPCFWLRTGAPSPPTPKSAGNGIPDALDRPFSSDSAVPAVLDTLRTPAVPVSDVSLHESNAAEFPAVSASRSDGNGAPEGLRRERRERKEPPRLPDPDALESRSRQDSEAGRNAGSIRTAAESEHASAGSPVPRACSCRGRSFWRLREPPNSPWVCSTCHAWPGDPAAVETKTFAN